MTANLQVEIIPALSDNYIYLLYDEASRAALVVDPSTAQPVLAALAEKQLKLEWIYNTHHHGDHTGGNLELKQQTGCSIVASAYDESRIPGLDRTVDDGQRLSWRGHPISVLATPGHTLGAVCYWWEQQGLLFTGDTLFAMGCGRLFEGTAPQMWSSLERLRRLPGPTKIYCGHEYTVANGRFAAAVDSTNPRVLERLQEVEAIRAQGLPSLPSTLASELQTNPFLRADDPQLRSQLQLEDAPDWRVFQDLRLRKDQF